MNGGPITKYPEYSEISSRSDMKMYYESARKEINSYKQAAKSANIVSRDLAHDKHEAVKQAKVASRQVLTLTKKQQATNEAKKAGYWSGASTIGVTILYETWKVTGFPGGNKWMEWWNHEAIYGVMVWVSTCTLAFFYRAAHDDS